MRLYISCEFSAMQNIHMKHQVLFSSNNKSKKNKVSSVAILIWRVIKRVKHYLVEQKAHSSQKAQYVTSMGKGLIR